ncbi:2'-5' RNA ligase family protein [Microvirga makkahensis]|uniref:2'-5' RNA ligase family protein n=1 Tax=Microvirga makkahensis TaxID=1128670 RepID=A0A7X3MQ82_9HYPH|nr:2'-5' RNA ligase family protein [Microvirga makkahensis]MXQ11221.1 2'-5' RNA ligase family protein [Microvirga makkahensis]
MTRIAPLILTLALDEHSFAFFDAQRRRSFPPERNFIPAHLTLFHHLPGDQLESIQEVIAQRCSVQGCFPLQVTSLRSLGRGVAYVLHSVELAALRSSFAREWAQWLTPQDRQKHQPHVTVQNNVDPQAARALLAELTAAFVPFEATGIGLDLWWYRGGPWEKVRRYSFPTG